MSKPAKASPAKTKTAKLGPVRHARRRTIAKTLRGCVPKTTPSLAQELHQERREDAKKKW